MLHKSFAHAVQRFDTQDFRGIIDRKIRLCYNALIDEQRRSSGKIPCVFSDKRLCFFVERMSLMFTNISPGFASAPLEGEVRIPSGCAISAVVSKIGRRFDGGDIIKSTTEHKL